MHLYLWCLYHSYCLKVDIRDKWDLSNSIAGGAFCVYHIFVYNPWTPELSMYEYTAYHILFSEWHAFVINDMFICKLDMSLYVYHMICITLKVYAYMRIFCLPICTFVTIKTYTKIHINSIALSCNDNLIFTLLYVAYLIN